MKRIITAMGLAAILVTIAASQDARPASPSLLKPSFGKPPIYFIENRGVYPDEVEFYVQGADKTLFFTREGITFRLKGKEQGWVVKLEFVGANPDVILRGENKQQAVFSYFKGPEKDWKTGLPTFSRIVYENLWPGIDLVYRAEVGALKYEFLVASQADPAKIRLRYRGASSVRRTGTGALEVETPAGGFEDAPPEAWQEIEGERVPVEMAYAVSRDGFHGFNLGEYDTTRPLVLDPVILVYCGYIGGTREDEGHGVSMDVFGNAYVTGCAYSDERTFPVTVGPDLTYNGGTWDAFVAKVNASGSALVYCGFIGGNGDDHGHGIAVDAAGNAYVTGTTKSSESTFPVTVGPDLTHNGIDDVFVAKVNASGSALVYCGFIGGVHSDYGNSIAVDASGNAFVTGGAYSDDRTFPVKVGPDLTFNGASAGRGGDSFVAKVNASGSALVYCGYIGGANAEIGNGIAVDAAGNAFVTGTTESTESTFPVTLGPDLTYNGGTWDAFVAKVNASGSALVYCGYIGGAGADYGDDVAVDAVGNAHVAGTTESTEQTFPVTLGPDLTFNLGFLDIFVAKVNTKGTGLVYCGYIGGDRVDHSPSVSVDGSGNVFVTGITLSHQFSFPVKVGPSLSHGGGVGDAFAAKVVLTLLEGSGTIRPGGTVTLNLTSTDDIGLPYQVGSSLGTGPISIDTRQLNLSPDDLLTVSVAGLWPTIFSGYRGLIDNQGQAKAGINIPNDRVLIGFRLHTAFVTLDPQALSGIKSISNTFFFSITK